jgi:hypothetical protein
VRCPELLKLIQINEEGDFTVIAEDIGNDAMKLIVKYIYTGEVDGLGSDSCGGEACLELIKAAEKVIFLHY